MAKNKIFSLLLFITACALTSCSFSDDFSDLSDIADASSPVNVNFTVSTRGEGDSEDTATGDANENDIKGYGTNAASYKVYFFDATDHKYIMSFNNGTLSKPDKSSSQASYTVSGTLSNSDIETLNTYKDGFIVVFIANWDEYPDDADFTSSTTIDDLCTGSSSLKVTNTNFTATFDYLEPDATDGYKGKYIPFYGVKKITLLDDDDVTISDNEVNLGKINLLRAMAKVTVVNVSKTKERTRTTYYPDLTEVKLVHYNAIGYCAPYGVYTEKDYMNDQKESDEVDEGDANDQDNEDDETEVTYFVEDLHLIDDNNDDQSGTTTPTINMYQVPIETNDSSIWIAYVPEYDNKTEGVTKCEIQYKVKCDGDEEGDDKYTNEYIENGYSPGTISFAEYKEGTVVEGSDYDVKRNRSYRFNVSLPKVFKLTLGTGDDDPEAEEW
ncbi:MAG: hypothetical protein LUD48_03285, partial [Prevotella sp.]|nr:hypothetical protein [Prevotella sp.]